MASTTLQSIRASCDRCRFYKLKCTVPIGSEAPACCERCTRAKVACVFGRRRRATRSGAVEGKKQRPNLPRRSTSPGPSIQDMNTAATLATQTSTPLCEAATATTAEPDQEMELAPMAIVEYSTDDAAVSSLYSYDDQSWENLTLGLHDIAGLPANVPDRQQSSRLEVNSSWSMLQGSYGLDDSSITDAEPDLLEPGLRSPSPFGTSPIQQPTLGGAIFMGGSSSAKAGTSSPNPAVLPPGQRLLVLIAEMQQRLRSLENGPWQHDSMRSLDDYPVGTVLHLSEEFAAIAASVLSKACTAVGVPSSRAPEISCAAIDLEQKMLGAGSYPVKFWGEGMPGLGQHTGSTAGDGCETTSTLLVLVGYMWLIRIYGVVLGHFQVHLSCIPSRSIISNTIAGHGGAASNNNNASTSPSLQLGELSYASAVPDLGKIHTAVCMLLTALHGVEEQLGQGGAVGRNLVVTLLTQEAVLRAGELQDGCGGLGGKVRSVNELLREKIGL